MSAVNDIRWFVYNKVCQKIDYSYEAKSTKEASENMLKQIVPKEDLKIYKVISCQVKS